MLGGGDFLGEAEGLGLGFPAPACWASMLACSFRTRSSSSFCRVGGEVHQGQRSPCILGSEDPWGRGLGTGVRPGRGGPTPYLPSEEVGKGQAALVTVTQPGHVPVSGTVRAGPRHVPGPCPLFQSGCLHTFLRTLALTRTGPGLTCRPSWSQSPCLLRGPSSSPGKGRSAGEREAQSTDPGAGWPGLIPCSVTLLK